MERDDVLQRLRVRRNDLTALKVKSLALFGSVARGQARAESDVDVLVDFEGPATFDQYIKLKDFLEDLLHAPVDLLTRKSIRPELAPLIEQEAVYVS